VRTATTPVVSTGLQVAGRRGKGTHVHATTISTLEQEGTDISDIQQVYAAAPGGGTSNEENGWAAWTRKAVDSIHRDLRFALRSLVVNTLCGSVLVPQILRTMLYRWSGLPIRSFNIREGQKFDNTRVYIGDQTFVSRHCYFEGDGVIEIGKRCQIAAETMFITSNHDRLADGTIDMLPDSLDIAIGDGTWIGARSIILPGTVIEEHCVIAAGAVVRGRCLAGQTYGGVPARLLTGSSKRVSTLSNRAG
jgi:maltose O-acetyltransferase